MNDPLIGQTLGGRYRIEDKIGEGGMSAVYRAFDPNLQRVVAIKVIKTSLASDQKFLSRFESEAKAVAQLRHANIVQVFDFNHDGDLYYMVQEFVPGETLQDRLKRLHASNRELSIADALHYAINIADAAGYAHRRGLIHRDIKPSNIMLDVHGDAILMDFGIVKILGGVDHTVAGAVVGTALYMPPELIRGEVPDPRSDIYSLGVALFEMVSGHPPFEADSAMTLLMMHLQDPVPDLKTLRRDVPQALSAIVQKALAKDRNDRYGSMSEMAAALGQVRSGASVAEQATSPEGVAAGHLPTEQQRIGAVPPVSDQTVLEKPALTGGRPPASTPLRDAAEQATIAPGAAGAVALPSGAHPAPRVSAAALPADRPMRGLLRRWPVWIAAAVVLLALVGGGMLLAQGGGEKDKGANIAPSTLPETGGAVALPETGSGTALAATGTPEPTMAGMPGMEPSPTPPLGRITISSITLDSQQRYVVNYDVTGFTTPVSDTMMHFFFSSVAPQHAGGPGQGSWLVQMGPGPFTGYAAADRPENAGALCVLASESDGNVVLGSGNCAVLPDVVALSAPDGKDVPCYFGPGENYPEIAKLRSGRFAVALGLSNDELWYNVINPDERPDACWISTLAVPKPENVQKLGSVDPPAPDATPQLPTVEITQILSDTGRYVVVFVVHGFTPHYPEGTHLHFFFNTFTPDQVGIGGQANRRSWGSTDPMALYAVSDRPAGATQMCVVIANPDHSVIPNTESCKDLPGLPRAKITGVSVDKDGQYVVDFTVARFTPKYPGGTHLHFYFNTFTPEQVGIGGQANRRSWGDPSPFTAYTTADRPQGATDMCVLVANPDHSVIDNSGNCFKLPDSS
jgi:serine/threonine protein kinase